MPTANDRLKASWPARFWAGLSVAAVLHLLLLLLGPTLAIADHATAAPAPMFVQPPATELPPAPEPLPRPAAPSFTDPAVDPGATLPSISFDRYVAPLKPPPSGGAEEALADFRAFVPSMTRPRLLNVAEVERALRDHYPRLLRDAGIGGQVLVRLWLDETGRVARFEVEGGSGHAALDAAALDVVDLMRLAPAQNRGRPARVIVTVPVVFRVE